MKLYATNGKGKRVQIDIGNSPVRLVGDNVDWLVGTRDDLSLDVELHKPDPRSVIAAVPVHPQKLKLVRGKPNA